MDIKLFCDNAARFLIDPENEKNKYPKIAWAVTIILGLMLGIPQMISGAWRYFRPEQENTTHQVIGEIFARFLCKEPNISQTQETQTKSDNPPSPSPSEPPPSFQAFQENPTTGEAPIPPPSKGILKPPPPDSLPSSSPLPSFTRETPPSLPNPSPHSTLKQELSSLFNRIKDKHESPHFIKNKLPSLILTTICNHIVRHLSDVSIKETIESSIQYVNKFSKNTPDNFPIRIQKNDLLRCLLSQELGKAFSSHNYESLSLVLQALEKSYPETTPESSLIRKLFEDTILREIAFLKNPAQRTKIHRLKDEDFLTISQGKPLKSLSHAVDCYPRNEELKHVIKAFAEEIGEAFKKDFIFIHTPKEKDPLEIQYSEEALQDMEELERDIAAEEGSLYLSTTELNDMLYQIRDDIPEKWQFGKEIFEGIEKWMNSYKISPPFFVKLTASKTEKGIKQQVAKAIVLSEFFKEKENPSIEVFISHLEKVIGFINKIDLIELEKRDLILARHLLSLRSLILEAADRIRPLFEQRQLDLENEKDRNLNAKIQQINEALERLLNIGLKLEVKMAVKWDPLIGQLAAFILNYQSIRPWVLTKQNDPSYDLRGFNNWLIEGGYDGWVARQLAQNHNPPPIQDCEALYSTYIQATFE